MKSYKCTCGKEFDNGRSLQGHKRTCKDYKQYKSIKQKDDLLKKEAKRLPNGMFKCENPKCGKEHDGSYGSGRFCSRTCASLVASLSIDYKALGLRRRGLKQNHSKQTAPYGTWKCKYCNQICRTKGELQKHVHDNHVKVGEDGRTYAWNKGLTKETDERIMRNALSVSKTMKTKIADGSIVNRCCSKYWTLEKRKEASEKKKQLYHEHPEKHPNRKLAGNRKKMTYPEQLVYDWLIEHQVRFVHQFLFKTDQFTRYVDFYIPERKLFIEVDGQYWHQQNLQVDIDKDNDAKAHGYMTERISTSERILTRLQQIFSK